MASKLPNGNEHAGGSSTQTLDSDSVAAYNGTSSSSSSANGHADTNGAASGSGNGVTANGHGTRYAEALVAVPEMCSYCFDVLDSELGGKGVKRQPCFTDAA